MGRPFRANRRLGRARLSSAARSVPALLCRVYLARAAPPLANRNDVLVVDAVSWRGLPGPPRPDNHTMNMLRMRVRGLSLFSVVLCAYASPALAQVEPVQPQAAAASSPSPS